jgi:hypothetical protein
MFRSPRGDRNIRNPNCLNFGDMLLPCTARVTLLPNQIFAPLIKTVPVPVPTVYFTDLLQLQLTTKVRKMGPLLLRKRKRISSIRALRWRAIRRNELALAAKKASHDDDNRGAYYQDHYDYDDDEEEEEKEEGEEEDGDEDGDGDGDGDREGDEDELDDGIRIQAQEEEWMEKDEVVEDEEDEAEMDDENEVEEEEVVVSTRSTLTAERVLCLLHKKHMETKLVSLKEENNLVNIKLAIKRCI